MNNNMYLYFDSNGYLKEFITCPARAGSENVNSIYFYVEPALESDRNKTDSDGDAYYALPNNLDHGVLTFKLHDVLDGVTDENGVVLNSLAFTSANFRIEDIQPFDKKRDLLFFKWFQKYQFVKVDLTADILLTPENVECTIGCYNASNTKVYNLDLFSFYVADSAVQSANYVTTSQYHMLLALMKSGLSSAVMRYNVLYSNTLSDVYDLIGTQIAVLNIDDKEYLVEMSSSGSIVLYDLYNREWYAFEGSDETAIDDITRYLYRYHIATKEDLEDFGNLFTYKGAASVSEINALTDIGNGWCYNLTDSGTLTLGNLQVETGDNVAFNGTIWTKLSSETVLGQYYTKQQGQVFESSIDTRVASVENQVQQVAQGSPKGVYATLADLQAAFPTGTTGIYVVSANGHWYYWNGSAWTDGGTYQATEIADGSVTIAKLNSYPKALINKNGNNIQEINGVVNLFNYDIVNKNIVSMTSDGVITEGESEHRFYNRTPIHLKVNDRIKVTDDNDFRFYTYYNATGTWQQLGWRMGEQTVSVEGDYIILFGNVANNKTLAELIANCNIYVQENNINSLENNGLILNEIKDEHFSLRTPRNMLDTSTLKIGYKRADFNNPYTLTADANYVVFDMVEILESGSFYLSRSNGTLQGPNPYFMVYAKDGKFIKRINNGDYVEKGWKVSINLGIATYNVWKDALQLEVGSYTNNFVSYFKPYYVKQSLKNKNVASIAHQGINVNNKELYGRNLVSSFINASQLGFDYAECDIQFSSDGVPVCCHDETFVDTTTQETVVIANKTYAELITYNYYGGTIASLDDVIKTCKEHGMGLYIDHMYLCDTDAKLNTVLSAISKYKMEEKIVFMIGSRSIVQKIQLWDIRSKICIYLPDVASESSIIALVEEWHNNYNEIMVYLSYSTFSVADLITLNSLLPAYAKVNVFTVDKPEIAKQYAPYVSGMISNLLTSNIEN